MVLVFYRSLALGQRSEKWKRGNKCFEFKLKIALKAASKGLNLEGFFF